MTLISVSLGLPVYHQPAGDEERQPVKRSGAPFLFLIQSSKITRHPGFNPLNNWQGQKIILVTTQLRLELRAFDLNQ